MYGSNLPGDCTDNDIDEHMKECEAKWYPANELWMCVECELMCGKEEFECHDASTN